MKWGNKGTDDGVIIVTNLADAGYGSLRDAIVSAAPGSTISFADDLLGGGYISI